MTQLCLYSSFNIFRHKLGKGKILKKVSFSFSFFPDIPSIPGQKIAVMTLMNFLGHLWILIICYPATLIKGQ